MASANYKPIAVYYNVRLDRITLIERSDDSKRFNKGLYPLVGAYRYTTSYPGADYVYTIYERWNSVKLFERSSEATLLEKYE